MVMENTRLSNQSTNESFGYTMLRNEFGVSAHNFAASTEMVENNSTLNISVT